MFKGDNHHTPHLKKNFNIAFFPQTLLKQNLSKFAQGLHFHVGLMTMTLFQGHRCVQYELQIVFLRFLFRFLCTVV